MAKYIFISGGVMSGIGKGVATASIGRILQSKGFKVTAVKIDPYVNVDAGTMNPIEHGEVFVTDDGVECDQDVGNYERFLDVDLTTDNYITTGRVYQSVINRERNLGYEGRCVEVVPHIPEEVIFRIKKAGRKNKADFVLIEIGGTVGEYQNMLFLEAARMMKLSQPREILFVLVSYLPVPKMIGEMKTKPTQYAVRTLNTAGIQPDIIIARSQFSVDEPRKRKISIFCNVSTEDVISAPDIESIYQIPINFEKDKLGDLILKKFGLKSRKNNLKDWANLVKTIKRAKKPVKIGVVGKYFETGKFTLMDSYISIIEAIKHSCWFHKRKPEIHWLGCEKYEKSLKDIKELKNYDGIIVPGGFGDRGVEGKIKAIEYCRRNKIPFLGLCLGMQLSVIEFARNVCKIKKACSSESSSGCKFPVIDVMPEQKALISERRYGGTMRLGAYKCKIKPGTISFRAYSKNPKEKSIIVSERHRHRYELNNNFRKKLEAKGMIMAGLNPERNLVEIIEIPAHPFFMATQFHPEFKSRPLKPHPLFREFIKACIKK
ncbi:MAG: CTP synthase [Candidatus Nealsonbacteria bacterium RBG_13_36_15]|uniref:CTP synthase n=1 Tax=Candidatus Nealsonbacteria bacterium RBG_13_36_15 TaxID=1801660 RepID=A0A1G2DWC7_9BACT|nr:MAG: CTP synthase [Candidatus Nealsonbacteria bacterium RBG_13_36_15]